MKKGIIYLLVQLNNIKFVYIKMGEDMGVFITHTHSSWNNSLVFSKATVISKKGNVFIFYRV